MGDPCASRVMAWPSSKGPKMFAAVEATATAPGQPQALALRRSGRDPDFVAPGYRTDHALRIGLRHAQVKVQCRAGDGLLERDFHGDFVVLPRKAHALLPTLSARRSTPPGARPAEMRKEIREIDVFETL